MSADAAVFDRYGRYFDLLYRDKDYRGEASYVAQALRRLGVERGAILELGCGTGRHGRLLASAGYEVFGVDRSEEMIRRAQAQAATPGFSCAVVDIRHLRLDRTFDAVVALFHVVSYLTADEDLLTVFRNARAHLDIGGACLFDVWYGPAVQAQQPTVRTKRVEDECIFVDRVATPDWRAREDRVDVHYRIAITDKASGETTAIEEVHPMRYFTLPELDRLAAATGFKREFAEEFMTGAAPSETTWGVCAGWRAV